MPNVQRTELVEEKGCLFALLSPAQAGMSPSGETSACPVFWRMRDQQHGVWRRNAEVHAESWKLVLEKNTLLHKKNERQVESQECCWKSEVC